MPVSSLKREKGYPRKAGSHLDQIMLINTEFRCEAIAVYPLSVLCIELSDVESTYSISETSGTVMAFGNCHDNPRVLGLRCCSY